MKHAINGYILGLVQIWIQKDGVVGVTRPSFKKFLTLSLGYRSWVQSRVAAMQYNKEIAKTRRI